MKSCKLQSTQASIQAPGTALEMLLNDQHQLHLNNIVRKTNSGKWHSNYSTGILI